MGFETIDGSWSGTNELWLEPNTPALESSATLTAENGRLSYTWSFKGKPHQGVLQLGEGGGEWSDTFHQPQPTPCPEVGGYGAIAAMAYGYPAPSGPDWHWRIVVCLRPEGELVVQMTNLPPWGEEAPAVRMVLSRTTS